MKNSFILLLWILTSQWTVEANLIKTIQDKNGDVYVLIRPKSGASPQESTGLWHYQRIQNYASNRLPLSDDSRILEYEGLSVDKFGHVKLFRTNSRENVSLWTLLNEGKVHPDSPPGCGPLGRDTYTAIKSYQGNGTCPDNGQRANAATFDSIKFGWSYVINTGSGSEGWYCIYPPGTHSPAYATGGGGGAPQMIGCRFERNDAQAASWEADASRNAKVINAMPVLPADAAIFPPVRIGSDPRRHPDIPGVASRKGQPWGLPVGFLAHGRGHFLVGSDLGTYSAVCGAGCSAGPKNPDRQASNRRRGDISPLLGWFWARYPVQFKPNNANGQRIRDLRLSKSKLFMEEFITDADNDLLKNSTTAGFTFTAGKDFYLASNCSNPTNYSGSGFLHCRNNPIDTAYAFAEEIESYNDCSDLCGQADPAVATANAVLNKGRAKFSSAGSNQEEQRAYIIKKYYPISGSNNDTFGVFKITNSSFNSYMDWKGDSLTYKSSGTLAETNGSGSLRKLNVADFVVAYNFNSGQGGNGNARSIQTSKRIGPDGRDDLDFIYVSDLAPSHFNVSSSFWGTGGMVWWAVETGRNLRLNYEQYNHFRSPTPLLRGSLDVSNATPLVAFGADGDNFVYILHGGGTDLVETAGDIDRITTPKSFARIKELCKLPGRVVKGCDGPVPGSTGVGFELDVEMTRNAGLKLEKIAPLPGSKPVRIGTVPLKAPGGSTCSATIAWPGPLAPLENDSGTLLGAGWICSGSDTAAIQAIIDENLIEMAVINVANPPATGGNLVMDIVEPPTLPISQIYTEDTPYDFNMENPPRFNGPLAQLSLSNNGDTNIYGDLPLLSNYEDPGINLIKEILAGSTWTPGTPIPASSPARVFYDNDSNQGRMLSSFIYQDLKVPSAPFELLMNDVYGSSSSPKGGTVKTLRYRWRVKALTPPHSFKDYKMATCVGLLKSGNGSAMSNVTTLTDVGLLYPNGNENLMNNEPGVLFDSCWQDFGTNNSGFTELVDSSTGIDAVVSPPTLRFKFEDPGTYEVQLWVGGLRFYADNFTFLDDPSTITMVLDAATTKSIVRVSTMDPKTRTEIKNVVIANNDLSSNQETRAAIYATESNALKNLADRADDLIGPSGRLPVFPIANFSKTKPLIVTYQNQHTPIVAEAEIQFFRLADLTHHTLGLGWTKTDSKMEKHMGVGAWDYSYPGGGKIPFGNSVFSPLDKTTVHPSNWSTRSAVGGVGLIATDDDSLDQRRGYDASGNYETGRGFTEAAGGSLINGVTGADPQFQAAHQGTLASDDAFPATYMGQSFQQDLISHPEAMYTWWEIKYAWFVRYTKPDGSVIQKTLKTGNLAEIFLLNHMAQKSSGWSRLVHNLAPYNIHSEGTTSASDSNPLMQYEGNPKQDRKIKVRIPLFNPNALLTGTKNDEMNQAFKDLSAMGSSTSFESLYQRIHPMSFNIPTEPTIIEIGFQLFYPLMNWEGREVNTDGSFNYFDAVYWGSQSEATGSASISDFTKVVLPFGDDRINIWPNLASQKDGIASITNADAEANLLGLKLAALQNINGRQRVPGGFQATSDSDDANYVMPGSARDDFIDLVVLDMKAPKIRLIEPAGGTTQAKSGGRIEQDIVIEVEDNNPYAVWPNYEQIGNHGLAGGSDDRLIVPSLVEISYEAGYDPRNVVGLGLKSNGSLQERAYGLNLSFTSLEQNDLRIDITEALKLPQYDLNRFDQLTSGKPIYGQNSGVSYTPLSLGNDDSNFYYPYIDASNGLSQNGGVWYQRTNLPHNMSTDQAIYQNSWHRMNQFSSEERYKLYPPEQNLIETLDSGVRLTDPAKTHPGLSKWMIRFLPDVKNQYPYNLPDTNIKGAIAEYVPSIPGSLDPISDYESWKDTCFSDETKTPMNINNADECKILTRWRIPKNKLVAPVFMNSTDNTLNIYAKARDVRISHDWPDFSGLSWSSMGSDYMNGNFGTWPKYQFGSDWKRRMGAENYGVEDDLGTAPSDLNGLVAHFYNNELQRRTTQLVEITVADNDIPNVHITLYEFKDQTQVEYAVISAQGNDPSISEDSKKLIIMRSKDKRNQIEEFKSDAILVQKEDQSTVSFNSVQSGMSMVDQAYHIPEDVRFMIQIEASDNKDLNEIEIEASSLSSWNSIFVPPTGYTHVSSDPSNKPFQTIVTSDGRIYNQSKIARGYHMYPNSGTFDVIQVHVKDARGNQRFINIPIVVVPQDVHFRSLGSQNQGR